MAKKKVDIPPRPISRQAEEIVRASMDEEPPPAAGGTVQTSRGYVTGSGVEKVRVSLHLTKAQRHRLKEMAFDAGKDVSEYVAEKLGL